MINMIFEDAEDSFIAPLLRSVYKDVPQVKLHFVGGSGNFCLDRYKSIYAESTYSYIYYDLIPDNGKTVSGFNNTRRKLRMFNNIAIIPILGLDYNILNAYTPNMVPTVEELCITDYILLHNGIKSMEGYFKYIVDNDCMDCMSLGRILKKEKSNIGLFYSSDCGCKKVHCMVDNITKNRKARMLLLQYPVFCRFDNSCISVNVRDIQNSQINKYNELLATIAPYKGLSKIDVSERTIKKMF